MEFNWSTFVLEIINFLVLVWILKRFLYKPVLDVIARRRKGIERQLSEARHLRGEAETMKTEYENRLSDWDQERQHLRDTLAQEIDAERSRQTEALKATLAVEREKAVVAESRRHTEAVREAEHRAMEQGAQFATRLLGVAAGPELEARLLDLLLEGLSGLSSEQVATLRTQWGESPKAILVTSVYGLPDERRRDLETALAGATGVTVPVDYKLDPELMAGLRITIGAWVLRANLRDELKGFTDFAYTAR